MCKYASKFLHTFLSPVVCFNRESCTRLMHKYETLLKKNKKDNMGVITQKKDEIFRDINIEINASIL